MKISNGVKIGGLQKTTLIDYPGKIAATVFLIGCNFRCPWCYAPHLVLPEEIKKQLHPVKPSGAGISPKAKLFNGAGISEKDFFKFLKERKKLIDGLVLCGGEPTTSKGLISLIKKIKKMGFFVKLDTNGSNPKLLEKLIDEKLVDYVAMDIKGPKEKYYKIVGMLEGENEKLIKNIEKSISVLKEGKVDYEFRSTIVPTLHTKGDVIEMAKWIRGAKRYYLQNFRPEKTIDPSFENIKPYPQEFLLEIQKAIAPFFEVCQVRG
jgi:pyruvate formate lyase activating enzyme